DTATVDAQLKKFDTPESLTSNPSYASLTWQALDKWPGYRVFVDDTHGLAVALQLSGEGKITAYRVFVLDPQSHVGSVEQCFAQLCLQFAYGSGADAIGGFRQLLPACLAESFNADQTPGILSTQPWKTEVLCNSGGDFLGLEGKSKTAPA